MRKRISLILATALLCVGNLVAQISSLPVPIGETKWRTLMAPVTLEIPDGITAYTVPSVSDGYVNLVEIAGEFIPANVPVLLQADAAGDYEFLIASGEFEVGDNLLEGTIAKKYVSMSPDYNYYVFDEGECVWLPAVSIEEMEDCFSAEAHTAYLQVPTTMAESYSSLSIATVTASGSCGENLTWVLTDEGELTILGTGAMTDYESHSAPWFSYKDDIKTVTINPGVTTIGKYAIGDCSNLTTVTIPEGVTSIGLQAFQYCYKLTSVTLSDGLKTIDWGAFAECHELPSIDIPEGVTTIGNYAFTHCYKLSSVTIPESVTSIGIYAFRNTAITSVVIPANISSLSQGTFENCPNLASITCKAETPPSVGHSETFYNVNRSIPVYVPVSAVAAYKEAEGWKEFTNILPMGTFGDNLTWMLTAEGELIIEGTGVMPDYTQPWSDYKQSIKTITVGEGITVLGSAAFSGCGKCTEVNLPNSLTDIRYEAFFACSSLPSITFPKNVRNVGGRVFCDCGLLASVTLNEGLESLGGETFRACGALKSIEIPSSMKEIAGAFYECKHLASVTIPEGVQKIASGAFCYCNDMASLTLPASLTSIGGNAFKQCVKLAYIEARATTPPTIEGSDAFTEVDKNVPVYVPASSVEAYKAADYWSLFANILPMGICGDELAWKLTAEGELIIEGTGAMTSAPWSTYAESIKKVTIKEGVTSIYDRAFEGCNQVETMTIPNSVVEVGTSAFNDCTGELFLNSMPVPAEGSMMMGGAFESCGFTKVIVGEGVTEIKDMAFFYSQNLAEVELPETIERIGDMAFAYCHSLTSITIPASVTTIDSYAFDNCVNFTTFVCKGMTPPTCIGELFYNVNKELTLFVPITAIANYQVAAQWKDFDYIVGTAMCGETLTGELWPDGKLIVKGEGAITTAPWEAYGEQVKELVLEEGVTGIADKSFVGFDNLLSITSYAENPPVCSAEAFNGVEKTTPVYVVPSKLEDYSVSEGWCEFIYLTSNDSRILLDSYVDYSHEEDESFEEIAYVRTFNNTNWQALYVPFEIPVTEEFLSDFEVADLNDIRQYDRDDDGVKDETAVEAFKVTSGTLKANYPYLIRAKEAGEKTIIVADATLYATKENSYDCSSLHEKYTFTPTYSRIEGFALAGCYALSGGVWQPIDEEEALGAFRFYLMIESRDGNLQVARTIRLRIIGGANDDNTTRIDTAESTANDRQSAVVYDLQGRRVVNPTKGIYIVNGKKLMY